MNGTHSSFGGSSSARWLNCPGSSKLKDSLPEHLVNKGNFACLEGSYAHQVARERLEAWKLGVDYYYPFEEKNFQNSGYDLEVTEEMIEAIEMYVDTIANDMLAYGATVESLVVEKSFLLSNVANDCYGVCDAGFIVGERLFIYDFKYGAGRPVFAENNSQLKYYAVGFLIELSRSVRETVKGIQLVIVQPRTFIDDAHISRSVISVPALVSFVKEVREAYTLAKSSDAECIAGYWCETSYCPCVPFCPTVLTLAEDVIEIVDKSKPEELSLEKIAQLLTIEDRVTNFYKQLKSLALTKAQSGEEIPGYKVILSRGVRKWRDESEVEAHLSDVLDGTLRRPGKLLPIGDVEKQLKKLSMEIPDHLTYRTPGKQSLVPLKHPGTAIETIEFMSLPII